MLWIYLQLTTFPTINHKKIADEEKQKNKCRDESTVYRCKHEPGTRKELATHREQLLGPTGLGPKLIVGTAGDIFGLNCVDMAKSWIQKGHVSWEDESEQSRAVEGGGATNPDHWPHPVIVSAWAPLVLAAMTPLVWTTRTGSYSWPCTESESWLSREGGEWRVINSPSLA